MLTSTEQEALLHIATSTHTVNTIDDLREWVATAVHAFFPHGMLFCGVGRVTGVEVQIERGLSFGYPEGYLQGLGTVTDLLKRPVLRRWLLEKRPQIIDEADVHTLLSAIEQTELDEYGLINIAAFGVVDVNVGRGTYFSFSRIPGPLTERHSQLLEIVVPYLHHALMRTVQEISPAEVMPDRLSSLTQKEREILTLIANGMSNREIAITLSRSELTIQTHVHSLLKKLHVTSRSGAVAVLRSGQPVASLITVQTVPRRD